MLRSGVRGQSANEVARSAVTQFSGLAGLTAADMRAVPRVRGISPAKAAQFHAAVEIVKCALHEHVARGDALSSPETVRDYLRLALSSRPVEVSIGLFLDTQHRLIAAPTSSSAARSRKPACSPARS